MNAQRRPDRRSDLLALSGIAKSEDHVANRDRSLIDLGGMGGAYCAGELHPSGAGMG